MKSRNHREAILDAARELSATAGFDAVSTAAVCRAAQVSNGTMFHYFPTKDALSSALYLRALESYQRGIVSGLEKASDARQGVRGIVLAHVAWTIANPDQARFLHERRRGGTDAPAEQDIARCNHDFFGRLGRWFQGHIDGGLVRPLPVDLLVAVVFGPIHVVTRDWMRGTDPEALHDAAAQLADAAWAALEASGEPKRSAQRRPKRRAARPSETSQRAR